MTARENRMIIMYQLSIFQDERKRDVETEKAFEANTQNALEREREALEVVRKKKADVCYGTILSWLNIAFFR